MTSFVRIMPKRKNAVRRSPLVVALAYDGLSMFEFSIAIEVFGLDRPEMGPDWYRFAIASEERHPLRATGGLRLAVDGGLALLATADIIVLPGWRGIDVSPGPRLSQALRRAHARGARLVSICSGAYALADCGLLDGKRATTHWKYMDHFAARFPRVHLERDVLYVDEGQVLTSAGSAAGIDLCLHLVRRDFGAAAANVVARRMVVPPHRDGGQLQFVEQPVPDAYEGDRLSPLIGTLYRRLDQKLEIARLAAEVGMSARTFIRRFAATTGMSPGRWITQERVRLARTLLETTGQSVESVSVACGFSDVSTLRRHFTSGTGVSPARYRARFRAG